MTATLGQSPLPLGLTLINQALELDISFPTSMALALKKPVLYMADVTLGEPKILSLQLNSAC